MEPPIARVPGAETSPAQALLKSGSHLDHLVCGVEYNP